MPANMPASVQRMKKLLTLEKNQNALFQRVPLQNGGHDNGYDVSTTDTETNSIASTVELVEQFSTLQINPLNADNNHVIDEIAETEKSSENDCSSEELYIPNSNGVDNCVQLADDKLKLVSETFDEANDDNSVGSDDESFYNNLFVDKKPLVTYESVPTDAFPCVDDSYNEDYVLNTDGFVSFFIDKNRSLIIAEYKNEQYPIGHLDITSEQRDLLKNISQTQVDLWFEPKSIIIQNNKLCIKQIEEREKTTPNSTANSIGLWFKILNLSRIQFSTFEPFVAKFDDQIYVVGQNLHQEYINLLRRTKKDAGIPIRLRKDRISVDPAAQVLDVIRKVSFEKNQKVVIISANNNNSVILPNDRDSNVSVRRYIVNISYDNQPQILEVESALIHSSVDDDCAEIYAECDFPFTNAETKVQKKAEKKIDRKVQKVAEKIAQNAVDKVSAPLSNDQPNLVKRKTQKLCDEEEWCQQNWEYNYLEDLPLDMMTLKNYAVPTQIKQIIDKSLSAKELDKTDYMALTKKKNLRENQKDYINGYKMMIYFEEEEQTRHLEKFNQSDIQIAYQMERRFWFPISSALSELSTAIEENLIERFVLTPKYTSVKIKGEILGQVLQVREQKIYIEIFIESFKKAQSLLFDKSQYYDICFKLNRVPYQLQHFALEFIENQDLFSRLINNTYYMCKKSQSIVPKTKKAKAEKRPDLIYEDTLLDQLNAEQEKAVQNIVRYEDKLPYVLFGPPGTGKTRTLIGAIEQIVKTTNEKILVCAMSNAACDEIAERLIGVLKEGEMYRFYAKSYKNERINQRVRQYSNFGPNGITYPSLEFLYKFRVLVCTLCSAGCLSRARVDKDIWKPDNFGYVIIDEAASAHEPITMIPIAGVCTSPKQIHAKIVLAGDPKQLDAVVMSKKAKALGYSTSWLEHLCSTELYSRNKTTGQFNDIYITQLVKNYRSHPHILRVSNELYYNNKLEPNASKDNTNWYINSKFLPSKYFPIKFISVQGNCQKSIENSWFNVEEIEEVVNVIKQLLPPKSKKLGLRQIAQSDIGVVTPYRKQRFALSQKLRRINFGDIMVGTAEIFQGKEKPVMIVSTVRSNRQLGFIGDPRRLNVVITRAKSLLVIIGDPFTLGLSKDWRHLMQYCHENNSFVQSKTHFSFK